MAESLRLDARYPTIGRIAKASGVFDRNSLRLMKAEFKELAKTERGREILRAVQFGTLSPLKAYEAARRRALHELPDPRGMGDAETAWKAWIASCVEADEYSDDHIRGFRNSWNRIKRYGGREQFTVADFPLILHKMRAKMAGAPRAFNLTRAHVLAFLRQLGGKRQPLYLSVADVPTRRHKREASVKRKKALMPSDLITMLAGLPADRAKMAWTMAITGMGPKEYWGEWEQVAFTVDGVPGLAVHIHGKKRAGRDRRVPLIFDPVRPSCSLQTFRKTIWKVCDYEIAVYDLRRCFARWMELARIPRARRKLYLGHGVGDITGLYEEHEIDEFLVQDSKRMMDFITASSTVSTMAALEAALALAAEAKAQQRRSA